jgi:hypothetical protein
MLHIFGIEYQGMVVGTPLVYMFQILPSRPSTFTKDSQSFPLSLQYNPGTLLKISHDGFLSHSYQFIIHNHQCYIMYAIEKASLKKPGNRYIFMSVN